MNIRLLGIIGWGMLLLVLCILLYVLYGPGENNTQAEYDSRHCTRRAQRSRRRRVSIPFEDATALLIESGEYPASQRLESIIEEEEGDETGDARWLRNGYTTTKAQR